MYPHLAVKHLVLSPIILLLSGGPHHAMLRHDGCTVYRLFSRILKDFTNTSNQIGIKVTNLVGGEDLISPMSSSLSLWRQVSAP